MSWGRLDDSFHDHPKVEDLSLAAIGLWTVCLTRALRHRKTAPIPGFVSAAQARKIAGSQSKRLTAELSTPLPGKRFGLWEPAEGGWIIHDFADYLPKDRDPEEAAESGRKGAAAKWAKQGKKIASSQADSHSSSQHGASKEPSSDLANGMAVDGPRASRSAYPSRPVPPSGSEEGERTEPLAPSDATELPPEQPPGPVTPADARCTAHQGVASPPPCIGCGNARQRAEKAADREAERRARELEDAIRSCPDCEGTGKVLAGEDRSPTRRTCNHPKVRRSA